MAKKPLDEIAYDFRLGIMGHLRNELAVLKTCQLQMISLALTGTGIILTLVGKTGDCGMPYIYLLPLTILLPFGIVFFDKARTISRITGFLRILERNCIAQTTTGLVGWENAMKGYWKYKVDWDTLSKRKDIVNINRTINKNRRFYKSTYWFTTYLVLVTLSWICILLYCLNTSHLTKIFSNLSSMNTLIFCGLLVLPYIITIVIIRSYWRTSDVTKSPAIAEDFGWFMIYSIVLSIIFISVNFVNISELLGSFSLTPEILFFWGGIFISQVVALSELWFFYNLVRGRYSQEAFEERWQFIIDKIGQISHRALS